MRRIAPPLAVTVLLALAFGGAGAHADSATVQPEKVVVEAPRDDNTAYRLGAGDKVRVTVYGEDDLSGEFQVDGAGTVQLPLIGQVKAAGLTAEGLAGSVTAALADGYLNHPRVSVEVTTYRPFYIIGEVNRPGEYPYVNGMTALNAVALAGGFTTRAEEDVLYLRKEGDTREAKVAADQTTKIQPGDILRVRQTALSSVSSFVSPVLPIITPICTLFTGNYC